MLLMWHCTDSFLLTRPPSPPGKPFFQESHLPLQAKQLPKLSFPSDTSTLALVCILSLILNCTHTIPFHQGTKVQVRKSFFFFLPQKIRQVLHKFFFNPRYLCAARVSKLYFKTNAFLVCFPLFFEEYLKR